jgi:hypothetical protein
MQSQNNSQNVETVRSDYQLAVNLLTSEENGIWTRSNFMLLANSIVIAAISIVLTSKEKPLILIKGLPIFGIILCIIWLLLIDRGFSYRKYFILSARELEACIPNSAKILTKGEAFSEGKNTTFEISGCCIHHRMSWFGRLLSGKNNTYLIIVVFMFIYIFTLFL